jgi:hypothetical protein
MITVQWLGKRASRVLRSRSRKPSQWRAWTSPDACRTGQRADRRLHGTDKQWAYAVSVMYRASEDSSEGIAIERLLVNAL